MYKFANPSTRIYTYVNICMITTSDLHLSSSQYPTFYFGRVAKICHTGRHTIQAYCNIDATDTNAPGAAVNLQPFSRCCVGGEQVT